MREFDLVVIGAGPGGYEAALEAARVYKMKTALVEKSALGGTCLNRGCIPTKALLHSAAIWRQLKEADHCGISVSGMSADPEKMHQYKDEVTGRLRDGIAAMMKQQKVSVFSGAGMITDAHHVKVTSAGSGEERELETEYILIATGSVVSRPPIPGLDLPGVLTSDELLEKRDSIPEQLVIIGGGVIGMEFAFLYGSLGTKVTVIEALPRILANLDKEISQSLRMQLKKLEVDIHASAAVSNIYQSDDGKLVCEYREKETDQCVTAENILVCTGRRPFTEGLFAEGIDVETNRGRITTDEFGRTSIENVYAIGDVTGKIMLAHAAAAQGSEFSGDGTDPAFVPGARRRYHRLEERQRPELHPVRLPLHGRRRPGPLRLQAARGQGPHPPAEADQSPYRREYLRQHSSSTAGLHGRLEIPGTGALLSRTVLTDP